MTIFPPERLIYQYAVGRGEFGRVGEETSRLKRALLSIGFPSDASRRALICAYELGMNIVIHASEGTVRTLWKDGALEIVVQDLGPGIENIELAMKEGYSTAPSQVREMGYGAGMGLPNAKARSDHFDVTSIVGKGNCVICKILPGPQDIIGLPYFNTVRLDP